MKKTITLILVILIVFSAGGCKRQADPSGESTAGSGGVAVETLPRKTAAELAQEHGFTEKEMTGGQRNQLYRTPKGYLCKALMQEGEELQGSEAFRERALYCQYPSVEEEYMYYYDSGEAATAQAYENPLEEKGTQKAAGFQELLHEIGSNGLVVIGRPVGAREGHLGFSGGIVFKASYCSVAIDRVLQGETDAQEIKVQESSTLSYVEELKENRLYGLSAGRTVLTNDQPVLLFLEKSANGAYYISHYGPGMPLPADYASYNEEYLNQLCAYYNGDPSVCAHDLGQNGWPQVQRSNEETVNAFSDNVLVQAATRYHVKIWPHAHIMTEKEKLPYSIMTFAYGVNEPGAYYCMT